MDLKDKVSQLPLLPGVYLYKDGQGEVLYVGKAKNLRARVRNYFTEEALASAKNGTMISVARDIDYIVVDNEKEALALENSLIKQYKPRFNIQVCNQHDLCTHFHRKHRNIGSIIL